LDDLLERFLLPSIFECLIGHDEIMHFLNSNPQVFDLVVVDQAWCNVSATLKKCDLT
jgi:hypothetical protein